MSPITFPGLGIEINPSPVAFTVFGKDIYWYGIIIAAGMLIAYFLMCKLSPRFGLTSDNVIDMMLSAIPIGVVGARMYYCIFYWSLFRDNPISVLYIWEGGLAIYGGVIAGAIGLILYARHKKIPVGTILDLTGFGLVTGQIIGRWGNFMNREAHGCETTLPWRMGLVEHGTLAYYHPTFLYESLWNLVGLIIMLKLLKKRKYDGKLFAAYLCWYGLGRAWIEGLRTDSLYLFGTGIRVSQLLAVICFLCGALYLILQEHKYKNREPDLYLLRTKAEQTAAESSAESETGGEIRHEETVTTEETAEQPESSGDAADSSSENNTEESGSKEGETK